MSDSLDLLAGRDRDTCGFERHLPAARCSGRQGGCLDIGGPAIREDDGHVAGAAARRRTDVDPLVHGREGELVVAR